MKLAHITHVRCDEAGDLTAIWVPDDTTAEQMEDAVERAVRGLLADERVLLSRGPSYVNAPKWEEQRDRNVGDVLDEVEAARSEWREWQDEMRRARRGFISRLIDELPGARSFWAHAPDLACDADWGHNHGLSPDYTPTEIADPRPRERVDPDEFEV